MATKKPGPKSMLTEALMGKIEDCILDGLTLKQTAKIIGIAEGTLYDWSKDNILNLSERIAGWKRDRRVNKAEEKFDEVLDLRLERTIITDEGHEYEAIDPHVLRSQVDVSKFVAETLGKDRGYTRRDEITGKDGAPFIPIDPAHVVETNKALHDFLNPSHTGTGKS